MLIFPKFCTTASRHGISCGLYFLLKSSLPEVRAINRCEDAAPLITPRYDYGKNRPAYYVFSDGPHDAGVHVDFHSL